MQTLIRTWWRDFVKAAIVLVAVGPADHVKISDWSSLRR
jgi:hypothetical protein